MVNFVIHDLYQSTGLDAETMRKVNGGFAPRENPQIPLGDYLPKLPSPLGDYVPKPPSIEIPLPYPDIFVET